MARICSGYHYTFIVVVVAGPLLPGALVKRAQEDDDNDDDEAAWLAGDAVVAWVGVNLIKYTLTHTQARRHTYSKAAMTTANTKEQLHTSPTAPNPPPRFRQLLMYNNYFQLLPIKCCIQLMFTCRAGEVA